MVTERFFFLGKTTKKKTEKIVWKFVYVSMEQLAIVSAREVIWFYFSLYLFLHSWDDGKSWWFQRILRPQVIDSSVNIVVGSEKGKHLIKSVKSVWT